MDGVDDADISLDIIKLMSLLPNHHSDRINIDMHIFILFPPYLTQPTPPHCESSIEVGGGGKNINIQYY